MQGQFEEGIKFMESKLNDWAPSWMLACHNYWHTALFYLEKADFEKVLDIYDRFNVTIKILQMVKFQ